MGASMVSHTSSGDDEHYTGHKHDQLLLGLAPDVLRLIFSHLSSRDLHIMSRVSQQLRGLVLEQVQGLHLHLMERTAVEGPAAIPVRRNGQAAAVMQPLRFTLLPATVRCQHVGWHGGHAAVRLTMAAGGHDATMQPSRSAQFAVGELRGGCCQQQALLASLSSYQCSCKMDGAVNEQVDDQLLESFFHAAVACPCSMLHQAGNLTLQGLPCGYTAACAFKQWVPLAVRLSSLHLLNCQLIDEWFCCALTSLTSLTELSIVGCVCLQDTLSMLWANPPSTLVRLRLEGPAARALSTSGSVPHEWAVLPNLTELHIAPPVFLSASVRLPPPASLPALTTLSLQPDCAPVHLALLPQLMLFTQLRQLTLRNVMEAALVETLTQLPQLRNVHADLCVYAKERWSPRPDAPREAVIKRTHRVHPCLDVLSIGILDWDPAACNAPAVMQCVVRPQQLQVQTLRIECRSLYDGNLTLVHDRVGSTAVQLAAHCRYRGSEGQQLAMGLELMGVGGDSNADSSGPSRARHVAGSIVRPMATRMQHHLTRLELCSLVELCYEAKATNEARLLVNATAAALAPHHLRSLHLHIDHLGALLPRGHGGSAAAHAQPLSSRSPEGTAALHHSCQGSSNSTLLLLKLSELHVYGWKPSVLTATPTPRLLHSWQQLVDVCTAYRHSLEHLLLVTHTWGALDVHSTATSQQVQRALRDAGCMRVAVATCQGRREWWA